MAAADEDNSTHDAEHSRRYLESLLADYRREPLPGSDRMIELLEEYLARLPAERESPEGDVLETKIRRDA